jgi:hypothetical protein
MVAFILLSGFMNAETTSPQRVSSLFSPETLMAFFGSKFFLADRRTQIREKSKRLRRHTGEIISNEIVGSLPLRGYEDSKVGREHGMAWKALGAGGEWIGTLAPSALTLKMAATQLC